MDIVSFLTPKFVLMKNVVDIILKFIDCSVDRYASSHLRLKAYLPTEPPTNLRIWATLKELWSKEEHNIHKYDHLSILVIL